MAEKTIGGTEPSHNPPENQQGNSALHNPPENQYEKTLLPPYELQMICEQMDTFTLSTFVHTNKRIHQFCYPILHRQADSLTDQQKQDLLRDAGQQQHESLINLLLKIHVDPNHLLSGVRVEIIRISVCSPKSGEHPILIGCWLV